MPEEKIGIENLKKLVKFGCDLTEQIATALDDGKFVWTEALGFVDEIAQIPGVTKSFAAIANEIADLDDAERDELQTYLVDEFDLPNDKAEAAVENSLMQAVSLIRLYQMWKDIKNPPAPVV